MHYKLKVVQFSDRVRILPSSNHTETNGRNKNTKQVTLSYLFIPLLTINIKLIFNV